MDATVVVATVATVVSTTDTVDVAVIATVASAVDFAVIAATREVAVDVVVAAVVDNVLDCSAIIFATFIVSVVVVDVDVVVFVDVSIFELCSMIGRRLFGVAYKVLLSGHSAIGSGPTLSGGFEVVGESFVDSSNGRGFNELMKVVGGDMTADGTVELTVENVGKVIGELPTAEDGCFAESVEGVERAAVESVRELCEYIVAACGISRDWY